MAAITERAKELVTAKAREIDQEAHRIGVLRSLEATEVSQWLHDLAESMREAAGTDAASIVAGAKQDIEELKEILDATGGRKESDE